MKSYQESKNKAIHAWIVMKINAVRCSNIIIVLGLDVHRRSRVLLLSARKIICKDLWIWQDNSEFFERQ